MSHAPSFPPFDVSLVKGNASDKIKQRVETLFRSAMTDSTRGFADLVGARTKLCEVSSRPKADDPRREEATVVCELEVHEDMLNGWGNMHGACSGYLLDLGTALPLLALVEGIPAVSQSINVIYHAPATIGTPLRVVSTSIAVGGRVQTARGEIWDTKNSRLIASAVHIKMSASQPKL